MLAYREYTSYLDGLISACEWGNRKGEASQFRTALNGGASQALRNFAKEDDIKQFGAYFTSESLGRDALRNVVEKGISNPVFDPACGAGDLLLRWAEAMPVHPSLEATIDHWEEMLFGHDIHQEFINVTKRRLVLCAISRGAKLHGNKPSIQDRFPGIIQNDFLDASVSVPKATIITNPPFNQAAHSSDYAWTKGKVSQAAVFIAKCISQGVKGQRLVAILPDVLRSGSRYAKWRSWVENNLGITSITTKGRFDEFADVDVFVLDGYIGKPSNKPPQWNAQPPIDNTLETICDVRVGSVVPHRDPISGPLVTYFTAPDLPPWERVTKGAKRRVSSSTLTPPFVTVRRTSSPSDKQRPIATIVDLDTPVALENHLIALIPIDGKMDTCERIMHILRTPETREFLDTKIRCRHLTVHSLKQIKINL